MDKDDIIRAAREAGFDIARIAREAGYLCEEDWAKNGLQKFEHFAALVAAAERERIATKFMQIHNAQQHRNNYFAFAARVIREEV